MTQAPHITALDHRFIPAAQPSRRLMVVLHGLGDSMAGFFWMPGMLNLPAMNYLLVNAPNSYVMGYSWYDIDNPEPGVLKGRGLLNALFSELEAQGWGPEDVILFGFSQGCLMSIDFALRFAKPLAGIVGVSGYTFGLERLESEMHPQARAQAWLITHGTQDELLPVSRTRAQMETLKAAGIPLAWHEFPKTHTMDPEGEVPLIRQWAEARWP